MTTLKISTFPMLPTALITLLLTACAGAPPVPEEHFYRLPGVDSAISPPQPLFSGTLAIGSIDTPGIYNERALLHSDESSPTQLQRYHYHSWTDSPSRLIQDHLTLSLRHANAAPIVIPDNARSQWQYLLKGKLRRFERITGNTTTKVIIAMEFQLLRQGENRPLLIKDYIITEPAAGDTIDDTVVAFSNGLLRLYKQLLHELRQVNTDNR
ncbi:MAG: ABC-type transport auxiliary lipoprotein family protein [Candidatus Sedimenticola sp. (ex Thyasira tokunagai)]